MKSVLITGAGKRLGRELATKFKSLGWKVFITYNSTTPKNNDYFDNSFQVNLLNSNEIDELFGKIRKEVKHLDLVISNSGVFPKQKSLQNVTEDDWDMAMGVNLKAHFLVAKSYQKFFQSGKIINIASLGGIEIWSQRIPYNVSKAGLIQLTKVLAREMAPNFAVNAISPATILLEDEPIEEILNIEKYIPMKRHVYFSDLFEQVNFLANCTNYITGQNLIIDGGYSLVKSLR